MTLPVERKLPGAPISREQLVAECEDLHHRNVMRGPVASSLIRCALLGAGEGVPVPRAAVVRLRQGHADSFVTGPGSCRRSCYDDRKAYETGGVQRFDRS